MFNWVAGGETYVDMLGSRSKAVVVPPQAYFVGSAVFHYLGPAFAVLLFARVAPLGVAWLRIVSAAVLFALWRRPWRSLSPPAVRRCGWWWRSGSCSRS